MGQDSLEDRHLRSALEFAVLMAREGQKFKPPLKYPSGLKKHMNAARIPTAALGSLRRIVERDETFRKRIAAGALPELVDPIGILWLQRPDGWEREARHLAAEVEAEEHAADAAKQLKRSEKRREAAEQAAARAQAEIVALHERVAERAEVIDGLRTDVVKLSDELDELRAELIDTRNEARHARDREAAALAKLEAAELARDEAVAAQGTAEGVRDEVLADRAALAVDRSELARLAATAESLADQLGLLSSPPASGQPVPVKRKALPMPGGVLGDSEAAADHLLRSGASVLIDGYNVAKLAWPKLDLEGQRIVLLDALENIARRYGSDITVVFDGADIVGAVADGRRVVRVVWSPEGTIADDVIRDEVARLPASRQVVVVTNDREIVGDVKAMGANTMSSDQLIALMT
jgi:predicted RNA-binding protein with PIN domain